MMNDVRNDNQYQCEIDQAPPDPDIEGNVTILYVAGECSHFLMQAILTTVFTVASPLI